MHRIDIKEKENEYIVTFEMPGIREENILIKGENDSINVIAINKTVTTEMKNGNIDIDHKTIVYNKTAIVTNADFEKINYTFFAGWLEIIIPKKE